MSKNRKKMQLPKEREPDRRLCIPKWRPTYRMMLGKHSGSPEWRRWRRDMREIERQSKDADFVFERGGLDPDLRSEQDKKNAKPR